MALTGADLLAKLKELCDVSNSELLRAEGSSYTDKDGTEQLN
jgi:hypothetical protein